MKKYAIYVFLTLFPLAIIAMEENKREKCFQSSLLSPNFDQKYINNPHGTMYIQYHYVQNGELLFTDNIKPKIDRSSNIKEIRNLFKKYLKKNIAFTDRDWGILLRNASFYDECNDLVEEILRMTTYQNKNIHIDKTYGFQTALCEACSGEALKNVALLLQYGADPNMGSIVSNIRPLVTAIRNGNLAIIKLLAQHKDIKINDQDEFTKETSLIEAVNLILINKKPCKSLSYKKHKKLRKKIVKILLKAQANPYIKNTCGENAIHIARKNGFDEIANLMEKRQTFKPIEECPILDEVD